MRCRGSSWGPEILATHSRLTPSAWGPCWDAWGLAATSWPPPPTHWGFPAARCPGYCVGIPTESSVGVPTQYPGQRVAGNAPMRCQILSNPLRIMANAFQGAPIALPRGIGILAAHSRAPPNALPRGPEPLGILNVFSRPRSRLGQGVGRNPRQQHLVARERLGRRRGSAFHKYPLYA